MEAIQSGASGGRVPLFHYEGNARVGVDPARVRDLVEGTLG